MKKPNKSLKSEKSTCRAAFLRLAMSLAVSVFESANSVGNEETFRFLLFFLAGNKHLCFGSNGRNGGSNGDEDGDSVTSSLIPPPPPSSTWSELPHQTGCAQNAWEGTAAKFSRRFVHKKLWALLLVPRQGQGHGGTPVPGQDASVSAAGAMGTKRIENRHVPAENLLKAEASNITASFLIIFARLLATAPLPCQQSSA